MFKKWVFFIPLFLVMGCTTFPENPPIKSERQQPSVVHGIPKPSPSHPSPHSTPANLTMITIDHGDFQVFYDPALRSARYVKYIGLAEHMRGARVHRKDKFMADPMLVEKGVPYVSPKEYSHSGYDQGHLAPAGDFTYSQAANDGTFVMSNMSPQKPKLNRQAWRLLEAQVRKWICGEERVVVITGPIFGEHPETLKGGLPIPEQYFKIVIDDTPPKKTLAFIYNQTDSANVLAERVASISDVEAKTKINFDDQLPAELRPTVRTPASFEDWKEDDCR